jgi:hypothetical protein
MMIQGPYAPILPFLGRIYDFYVFPHHEKWMEVVFEETHSCRYLLVFRWEGERWRRQLELGTREGESVVELSPLHAPIIDYYHSLPLWGDLMAVVERSAELWIVVYQRSSRWQPVYEYKLL